MKKYWVRIVIIGITMCILSGCQKNQGVKLNPKQPVTITIWHYYNGAQKNALDSMINEFNETIGTQRGIIVEGHNQGDISTLEQNVMASVNKEVGSEELPNIFASYADTAYEVEKLGLLVDLDQYLTKKEQEEYIDSYIEEGRIGNKGELKIFPTAKSTEIMMMNKTDWDKFASATGANYDSLLTIEGLVKTAEDYYNWTDSLTPDIPEDGKAFYGRDAMANLFIIGSKQMGVEIFQVENQKITLNVDKEVMRRIWDTYYIPYINGYFASYGRFRSDDAKVGEIIAMVGSTTTASYFPSEVTIKEKIYPVESVVLPVPEFENGEKYAVQQGAGMVVTKSDPKKEYASVEFLKWFTEKERNLEFCSLSGYLPVRKDAYDLKLLSTILEQTETPVTDAVKSTLEIAFQSIKTEKLYTNKAFSGGSDARKILEYHLSDKAMEDRKKVREQISKGVSREEAVSEFVTEENFEQWFTQFKKELEETIQ